MPCWKWECDKKHMQFFCLSLMTAAVATIGKEMEINISTPQNLIIPLPCQKEQTS